MKTFIFCLLFLLSLNIFSQQWISFEEDTLYNTPGIPQVKCFYNADTVLFAGGAFQYGGNVQLNWVGKWDNVEWDSLSSGFSGGGGVLCFETYRGILYAGGGFNQANGVLFTQRIARWNGTEWEAIPNSFGELGGTLEAIVIYNDTLIIGTDFPSTPSRICGYDADINNYVDMGWVPNNVKALAVYNGELFAGGIWYSLKRYVGGSGLSAWEDVGENLSYYIMDMKVDTFNNFLYVGGGFNIVDDTIFTDNVAIWNGFYWEKVGYGDGYQSSVISIELYNGDLYAGLSYDTIGGVKTDYLARWDGSNWSMVGGGVKWGPWALQVFQNRLYIGGEIDSINGVHQKAIACWQDTTPNCRHLKPRVFSDTTTYYLVNDTVQVQFYNNNAYVDSWSWDFGDTGTDNVKDPLHIYTDTGTFDVEVIVTHGTCVDTAAKTIVVDYQVNVEEIQISEPGFKLYPNPTSNTLYIEITDKLLFEKELQIVDMKGKTIIITSLRGGTTKQSVDIKSLPKGVYFVNIGDKTERFVKE